jgi:hypothetical protein
LTNEIKINFYLKKIVIYTQTQVEKTKELPIVKNIFKQKINFFLNQKFLILKKIFFIF